MKKSLKWIIGILIGLVVMAVVLGAGYMLASRFGGAAWTREYRLVQRGNVDRSIPGQVVPQQRMPGQNMPGQNMPRYYEQNQMPMHNYGRMNFRPLGGLLWIGRLVGGAFRLALLGVVIFLAVTLALRQKQFKQPVTALAAQPEAEGTQAAMLACPHCARQVQVDWKHCPYCGNPLEPSQPDAPLA